ncbi:hypothetical protein E0L36_25215 [Streptomyces sp. AJS327]|uniref:hypothetical protein n=1 Tax=Streptomyces sp. AJS327 TaxID=2545265 RepID=UPI0015DE5A54|nr:hypothetical protein [Streptomyces sp. AJS327]MBA0054030.1 hypothetical protein [Streptomyces sp. AJS327]
MTSKKQTKRKQDRSGPALDWAAPHGPVSGALSATTGAGAVALLGAAGGMPAGWPLLVGAAGAVGHGIAHSIVRRLTARTLATRSASWLLAGGWTSWAITTGPLSWAAAGTLAALGVGIGAAATHAAAHEEAAEEERLTKQAREAAAELSAERRAIAAEWQDRIHRVTGVQVRVFAVEQWKTGAGFSLAAEMPGGGATWDQIRNRARALAGDARLPRGCVVHVEEGDLQGRVVLDIPTSNVMAGEYPYPDDYSPLSLLTGIPWGLLPHSEPVRLMLREACALILGPPGSGKSTFMDAVLTGFARCTDVLTWVIDLKRGGLGIPWVTPHLEAEGLREPLPGSRTAPEGTRPGVDWLAGDLDEAILMAEAALAINEARQLEYQRLMQQENTNLLPISPQIPQVMLVVDEGVEALSANPKEKKKKQLGDLLRKGMRTTRAMGVRYVLTAVDGNVSAIGDTQVRKYSPVGVALTSGESAGNNAAKLFPRARIDTTQLREAGTGVIGNARADGFAPTPFKGWMTTPGMVRDVVLATSDRRPTLDEPSARAAGDDYRDRWSRERAGWLYDTDTPTPRTEPTTTETPAGGGLDLTYKRRQTTDEDALIAEFRRQLDEELGDTGQRDQDAQERPGLNLSYQRTPESGSDSGDARQAALKLLIEAGPDGTGASAMERALKDTYGTRRPVIQRWLKEWAESGEIVRVGEGSKARYVHHTHTNTPPESG